MTVWNEDANPLKAWKVEDGDWVPVPDEDLSRCPLCDRLFESKQFPLPRFCSPGCSLRRAEMKATIERSA